MSWRIIALIVFMASLFSGCGETPEQEIPQSDEAPIVSEIPESGAEQVEEEVEVTDQPEIFDVSGVWYTSLGEIILFIDGEKITGEYPLGTLEGTLTERRFDFTYNESGLEGTGWFEFTEEGTSFTGFYVIGDVEFEWNGVR